MRAIAIQGLARRLLTHEADIGGDQEPQREAVERVADKLREHLSKRIGQEGFRTLLARALALTMAQFPYLSAVGVGADGSLVGLGQAVGPESQAARGNEIPGSIPEGAVALVAHLFALLVTFIGEELTLRIFSAVWPELDWNGADDGGSETL